MKNNIFIINLNGACLVTLSGILISISACFLLLSSLNQTPMNSSYYLGMSLIFLGMLADALDGVIARKMNWTSEFGRYLDGFGDVFLYLIFPNLALLHMGAQGTATYIGMLCMIAGGVLRLSYFNVSGNEEKNGKLTYRGLPVFWSLLLLIPLHFISMVLPSLLFSWIAGILLLSIGILNIVNKEFFKPSNVRLMAGILLSASLVFFFHFLWLR